MAPVINNVNDTPFWLVFCFCLANSFLSNLFVLTSCMKLGLAVFSGIVIVELCGNVNFFQVNLNP